MTPEKEMEIMKWLVDNYPNHETNCVKIWELIKIVNHYHESEVKKLNIPVVNGSFMSKENKCKYSNTLNDIHSKIVTYKDYWLFTEVFCLLHDNKDFCNCR